MSPPVEMPQAADVRRAAAAVAALLVENATRDWTERAGELEWSVTKVAAHLVDVCDIAEGWAQRFEPDRTLCRLVLAWLFPWAPHDDDPWHTLRWANGRIALPGHPRLAPDWVWWSAPLTEWDGKRPGQSGAR